MTSIKDTATVLEKINDKLKRYFNIQITEATKQQLYNACAAVVRDILLEKRNAFSHRRHLKNGKRVYYICMEFLLGQSLKTNLFNLQLTDVFREAVAPYAALEDLYDMEPDAGLGNGGLGRLAACFMDSLASLAYPAMGDTIRND